MISVIFLVIVKVHEIFGGFIFLPRPPTATSLPEIIINRDELSRLPVNLRSYTPTYTVKDYWPPIQEWPQAANLPEIIINRDQDSVFRDDQVHQKIPLQIKMSLKELKCQPGVVFRAQIHMISPLSAIPVIENTLLPNNCPMRYLGDNLKIEIPAQHFQECGVSQCGDNLCLRLRFPHIEGLRTSSDGLLTLKCRAQESFAVQNHALRLSVGENLAQSRTMSSVIEGGSQLPFRSQIGLFRRNRNDGSFTEPLAEGGEVLLGEDLMLKAQVKAEDGKSEYKLI